jgi:gliding motility-associated protein GldL
VRSAKLQHWPIANFMLPVGMITEAFIFTLLGILPPHKDYYWERYYPNLDENPHVEAYRKGVKFQKPAAITIAAVTVQHSYCFPR